MRKKGKDACTLYTPKGSQVLFFSFFTEPYRWDSKPMTHCVLGRYIKQCN